jgi:hypothetical protein
VTCVTVTEDNTVISGEWNNCVQLLSIFIFTRNIFLLILNTQCK